MGNSDAAAQNAGYILQRLNMFVAGCKQRCGFIDFRVEIEPGYETVKMSSGIIESIIHAASVLKKQRREHHTWYDAFKLTPTWRSEEFCCFMQINQHGEAFMRIGSLEAIQALYDRAESARQTDNENAVKDVQQFLDAQPHTRR